MIFVWSRWGPLIPVCIIIGLVAGSIATAAVHIPDRFFPPAALLVSGLIAGGLLFLADHKIQEGSGYVFYDPGRDEPRVVEESSGHFMFIPMKLAKFIVPAAALFGALYTLFVEV